MHEKTRESALLPPLRAEKAESGKCGRENHAEKSHPARAPDIADLVSFRVHARLRAHQVNDADSEQNDRPHPQEKGNQTASPHQCIDSSNSFIQLLPFRTSRGRVPSGGPTIPSFSIRSIKCAARP